MPNERSWKPSYSFDQEMRTDPQFIKMLESFADPIAERAREIAPVGPDSRGGPDGSYRDSIHVAVRTGRSGRKRVAVVADDWKATLIEFGTEKMRAYAPLRKAARQKLGARGKHSLGAGTRIGTVKSRRKRK